MAEIGRCIECSKRLAIHIRNAGENWCKNCSHLAPPPVKLKTKKPKRNRITLKWTLADKIGEDE